MQTSDLFGDCCLTVVRTCWCAGGANLHRFRGFCKQLVGNPRTACLGGQETERNLARPKWAWPVRRWLNYTWKTEVQVNPASRLTASNALRQKNAKTDMNLSDRAFMLLPPSITYILRNNHPSFPQLSGLTLGINGLCCHTTYIDLQKNCIMVFERQVIRKRLRSYASFSKFWSYKTSSRKVSVWHPSEHEIV